MNIIEKKVYYCDYCKKYRLTKYSMELHEKKCLLNPNRVCTAPYCAEPIGIDKQILGNLRGLVSETHDGSQLHIEQDTIEKFTEDNLESCPICTLAYLCQLKIELKKEDKLFYWEYNFKTLHEKAYADYRKESQGWY